MQLGGWFSGLSRVEASIVVDGGEAGREVGLSVERREEDVITGILSDVGELGVEAGSEEARCRQKAAKESMMALQAEERMKECDSQGELGDMGVDCSSGQWSGKSGPGGARTKVSAGTW